jgi:hypothetical protein
MRPTYTPRSSTILLLAFVAGVTACGDKTAQQASSPPAREIQLAPNAASQPQLNDTAIGKAPAPARKAPPKAPQHSTAQRPQEAPPPQVVVRPLNPQDNASTAAAPAPAPAVAAAPAAPPAPSMGVVSAGTAFTVQPVARVCTNTFKAGDRFTATLAESVNGSDGAVIPSGSSVVLRVDQSTRSNNGNDSLRLTFGVVSVRIGQQSYEVTGHVSQTTPLERVRVQTTGDQAKKVGAGALIGALAGQLLGKNTKSTVVGGAVGAAAGAAVAAGTADYDGCVPTNAGLVVNLDAPLRIRRLEN